VASLAQKSATWDEPIHLTAGYLALSAGDHRVDPSHPPLLRMWAALPLLAVADAAVDTSEIDRTDDEAWQQRAYGFATRFLYREQDADRLLYAGRFMTVLFGVALGILLFAWAHEWLGFRAAVIALAFFTIEPNLAAHAQLVTTDLGAAFFMFATVYCLWRTCRAPHIWNVAALTVCFSLAFIAKFSAVLLVPIGGLLMGVALVMRMGLRLRMAAAIVVLLIASTVLTTWAVYGFRHAPSASDGWLFRLEDSRAVKARAPRLGLVIASADALHLLPNAFSQGFLLSRATAQQRAYLAGEYSDVGWWYYFPVAFLLKTPATLIVLFIGGLCLLVVRRRQLGVANGLFVVLPVVVYTAFAMASGVNVGLRHLLPVYPFVLLVAAAAAKALIAWKQPIGRLALVGMVAYWGVRYANTYPHMLTYFSEFAGGSDNAIAYLADSNVDWGQDLKPLNRWMQERKVDHVNLLYFGSADPEYYGIKKTSLPGSLFANPAKPVLPGYVAISGTHLTGVYLDDVWRFFYQGFLDLQPIERVGNSIYVYRVDRWPVADRHPDETEPLAEGSLRAALGDRLFFDLGWADGAVPYYQEALERMPDDATVMRNLGIALLNTGRTKEAVSVLERVTLLHPLDGLARYRLAVALLNDGRTGEALVQAEAAVRLRPDDPDARELLGFVRRKV
jgi:tetratricopeptide (TPR) repeat protein